MKERGGDSVLSSTKNAQSNKLGIFGSASVGWWSEGGQSGDVAGRGGVGVGWGRAR